MSGKSGLFLMVIPLLSALFACQSTDDKPVSGQRAVEKVKIENFALLDHLGRYQELYYYSDMKAVVLFIQGNACPIVRNSISTLKQIRKDFETEDVVFLMLNANPQDNRETIAIEAEKFDIDFSILDDDTQLIAESLNIERTAEVFVIDPSRWEIIYRGPVDDRLGFESQKQEATRHYLTDALNALLQGEAFYIESPSVPGCLISFPDRQAGKETSYAGDIVPILKNRCLHCHQTGGIAPWAMTDYETIRGWSSMMREVVRTRRMPPWHADPEVGYFSNDFSMSADESGTLVRWIENGAQPGEGPDALAEHKSTPSEAWPLGEPDLVLELEPQNIPETGLLEYRYISVPIPIDQDQWVRAFHIRPSRPEVLHHAMVYSLSPGDNHQSAAEMIPPEAKYLASYGPGEKPAHILPQETGLFLAAGSTALFELHYTPTGRPEIDAPRLALYYSKSRPRHMLKTNQVASRHFAIPPWEKEHIVSAAVSIDRDILLYEIAPHMHLRGKWINIGVKYPDGGRELLLAVPDYRFYWQRFYTMEDPKYLPAGTEIQCLAAFDNSPQNPPKP